MILAKMPSTIWALLLSVIRTRYCHKSNHVSWDTNDKFRLECGRMSCSPIRATRRGQSLSSCTLTSGTRSRLSLFWKPLDFGIFPGLRWQPLPSSYREKKKKTSRARLHACPYFKRKDWEAHSLMTLESNERREILGKAMIRWEGE